MTSSSPLPLEACYLAENAFGFYAIPREACNRPAARTVLGGGVWEPQTLEFIRKECGGGGDVVHAGAFFGDFLPALSRFVPHGARVWAFEPNPVSFACAEWTRRLNSLHNVSLEGVGLGSATSELLLTTHGPKGNPLGGASSFTSRTQGVGVQASVRRIDDLLPKAQVSVIHLDVEDFEEEALRGGEELLQRCRPTLVLEHVPRSQWWTDTSARLKYRKILQVEHNSIFRAE